MVGKRVQFNWSGALHVGTVIYDGSSAIGHRLTVDVDTLGDLSVQSGMLTVNIYNGQVKVSEV